MNRLMELTVSNVLVYFPDVHKNTILVVVFKEEQLEK